ncbi:MAG: AsmA family protein [Pseudomonadota bacterium]
MKSLIKWLLIGVLLIVLVPVLIGLVASIVIDPNEFKPQLIEVVEKNTRGSLTIDGELNWSVFPNIGVELNQVTYALPEDKDKPFASLDGVQLGVKLLPLLRMAVEADGLTVSGLNLNMYTNTKGVSNWEQIFPEAKASDQAAVEDSNSGVTAGPLAVDIARIAIKDSAVTLRNDQEDTNYLLEDFNFESTDISADGDEFPLDISFNVTLSDPALTSASTIKTRLSADVAKQLFTFKELNADFLLAGAPFNNRKVSLNVSSSGQYNGENSSAKLEELKLALAGVLNADMQVDASGLSGKPAFAGKVSVAEFDLNKLMTALGMEATEYASDSAMSSISFNGTLNGPANSFLLNPVNVTLDSTKMTGRMGIKNLDTSEYVFVLRGDKINIDDYSAPAEADASVPDDQPNAALLPLAALRDLLFSAEFGFKEMVAGGMNITDLDMSANGNKGLIKLKKLSANLYEGNMNMSATVDARKDTPTTSISAKLANVQLKPLMTDFAEMDTISGVARFDAKLTTRGNSTAAFQSNLNGPVTFGIDNAILTNLNADKLACQAIAQVRQKPLPADKEWPATTTFQKLGGAFNFVNGVGRNDDLVASLDNMRVTGNGVVDLNAENVDYQVALNISGDLAEPNEDGEKSACAINEKYRGVGWPMRCKGSLDADPGDMCGIDTKGLTKVASQLLKAEAKSKLAEKLFGKKKEGEEGEAEEESAEDQLKKKLFEKLF